MTVKLTLWLLLLGGGAAGLFAQDSPQTLDDQKLLRGLRQRHLFGLCEKYVGDRLASESISAAEQSALYIELIRCRTGAAIHGPPGSASEAWQRVFEVQQRVPPGHPRALPVKVQSSLAMLARGKQLGQQYQVGVGNETLRDEAQNMIGQARRSLEGVAREIEQALPGSRAANTQRGELDTRQLRGLKTNVQFQIAVCNMEAARLFPESDRRNRIDSLTQVLRRIDEVAALTSEESPLWWPIQVHRIEAHRLLGDRRRAMELLADVRSANDINSVDRESDWWEQRLLTEVTSDTGADVLKGLLAEADRVSQKSPGLEIALVQCELRLAGTAAERSQHWQDRAAERIRNIGQSHGPYWARLAELQLIGTAGGTGTGNTNTDLLIRVGDEAWRKENMTDARLAFQKALALATGQEDEGAAMKAGMKLGRIFELENDHARAGRHLTTLAAQFSGNDHAAAAHLRGCWNWAQAAREKPELGESFAGELENHLAQWPGNESAGQAALWLGQFYASQKKWTLAWETLLRTPNGSPQIVQISRLIPVVALSYVESLPADERQAAARNVLQRLLEWLQETRADDGSWNDGSRELLLAAAKFTHRRAIVEPRLATLLKEALQADGVSPEWTDAAKGTLLVELALNAETRNEATAMLDARGRPLPDSVLTEVYQALGRYVGDGNSSNLNQVRLAISDAALARHVDTDDEAEWLSAWHGRKSELLVATGRGAEAVELLERLIEASPRDGGLRLQLARALTQSDGVAEKALRQWRIVASGSRPQSERWYEAKYNVAKMLIALGENDDALKMLRYLKAVPPGWSNSNLAKQFDSLLDELDTNQGVVPN